MDNLEQYISNNKDQISSFELSENHLDLFSQKLADQSKAKNKRTIMSIVKYAVAAMLIVAIGTSTYFYTQTNDSNNSSSMSLGDLSPEYQELEGYLKTNVDKKMAQFKSLKCEKDIPKDEIIEELKGIDTEYYKLQKDLLQNKGNERIINAMINCYQMKAEVLEQIINQINDNC